MRSISSTVHEVVITDNMSGRFKFFLILGGENGKLCFVDMFSSKVGSPMRGAFSTMAATIMAVSNHPEELRDVLENMRAQHYSPCGSTNDPEIPYANSISHYIAEKILRDFEVPEPVASHQS